MIESYLVYAIVGLMSGAMIMPIAYDLMDSYRHKQTVRRLQLEHETRVHCAECSNYKHQNKMFTLDICLDCYDLQISKQMEEING